MALTFNGASSKLIHVGAVGSIITAYPFSMFCWMKVAATVQNGFPVVLEGTSGDLGIGGTGSSGILNDTSSQARAYQSVGSGIAAFSTLTYTAGTWAPVLAVFTSTSSRTIYLISGAGSNETTSISSGTMSGMKTLAVGVRSIPSDNWFKGDIGSVALWSSALSSTDWTSLIGGAVPSNVQNGTLIDYWSLLTQGSSQTGINGRVLTATSTSQAADHPISEGVSAPYPGLLASIFNAVAAGRASNF